MTHPNVLGSEALMVELCTNYEGAQAHERNTSGAYPRVAAQEFGVLHGIRKFRGRK